MARTPSPPTVSMVPSAFIHLLDDYLRLHGIFAKTDAPASNTQISLAHWQQRLADAASALNDPQLGLHLGKTISPKYLGVLGYVLLSCGTLGAALQRFERYQRLIYNINPLRRQLSEHDLHLCWGVERGRPGALADECAIAALVQFGRDISQSNWPLSSVQFVNPPPQNLKPYIDFFGCHVAFNCSETRISIPLKALVLPLRQPDADLHAVLSLQAEKLLADLPHEASLEQQVRQCIALRARHGDPSLAAVAADLHLSTRTLHRKLTAQGHQFRTLLDDTRGRLAQEYLADPGLQLAEIAQLLGFSEQSAFNRFYQRWAGQTPRQDRKTLRSRRL